MTIELVTPIGRFKCAEFGTAGPLGKALFEPVGEYRAPKEGDWYLWQGKRFSEARRAHIDHEQASWILQMIATEET
jgi:hypothetical protein